MIAYQDTPSTIIAGVLGAAVWSSCKALNDVPLSFRSRSADFSSRKFIATDHALGTQKQKRMVR